MYRVKCFRRRYIMVFLAFILGTFIIQQKNTFQKINRRENMMKIQGVLRYEDKTQLTEEYAENIPINKNEVESCIIDFNWDNHQIEVLERIADVNEEYKKTKDVNTLEEYDFIVVGAGSSGSTLVANLLSTQSDIRVLLIEAGLPVMDNVICDSSQSENVFKTQYNCEIFSVPQVNVSNRRIKHNQGCGLGGSSLINDLLWTRGDKAEYDDWAVSVGDDNWSYDSLLPYFKQLETYYSTDNNYRGFNGPIHVSAQSGKYKKELAKSLGFKPNDDYNSETMYGISNTQMNIKSNEKTHDGLRQDAFSTQLREFIGSDSLDILIESRAVKVLIDENTQNVQYLTFENNGEHYHVRARYDVILSAGPLNTPVILMRSGIGNCAELKTHRIKCHSNLKQVGVLQSQFSLEFKMKKSQRVLENILLQVIEGNIQLDQARPKPKFQITTDYKAYDSNDVFIYTVTVLHAYSRGTVKLSSINITEQPIVNPNYLSRAEDVAQAIEAFDLGVKFGKSLETLGLRFLEPMNTNLNSAQVLAWINNNFQSTDALSGTCKMDREENHGVVNSKLNVFGVNGLRVADASIMPEIVTGNLNCPKMMIGAKCAQILTTTYF